MCSWKRAYLHTVRKKGKTILMLAVLFIITTMIQLCFSIRSATDTAAWNVRKSLKGSFTVNAKQLPQGLNEENISAVSAVPGVNGFALRSYTRASFTSLSGAQMEIKTVGASQVPAGMEHAGKAVSTSNSSQDTYFTEAGFVLTQGRAVTQKDRNAVLVHEDFAERNGLSLGDSFLLSSQQQEGQHVPVKITGIFTNEKEQDAAGAAPSYDLYENVIFIDLLTYSELDYGDGVQHYQYGDFQVEDPEQLERILTKIKEIPDISWKDCVVTPYASDYQNAKASLQALQSIVSAAAIVIIVISIFLVSLILALWIRNRIPEIGALMAMGISKGNILLQQILELFLIAIFAFILSLGFSCLTAQHVGNSLIKQVEQADDVKRVDLTKQAENEEKPVNRFPINVTIHFADWFSVCAAGSGIILAAVLITAFPLMHLKPKKILTKMS